MGSNAGRGVKWAESDRSRGLAEFGKDCSDLLGRRGVGAGQQAVAANANIDSVAEE